MIVFLFRTIVLRGLYNFTVKLFCDTMIIHFVVLPHWEMTETLHGCHNTAG